MKKIKREITKNYISQNISGLAVFLQGEKTKTAAVAWFENEPVFMPLLN